LGETTFGAEKNGTKKCRNAVYNQLYQAMNAFRLTLLIKHQLQCFSLDNKVSSWKMAE